MRARFFHVKVLQKLFDTAKEIAAELGPWCADRYLMIALGSPNVATAVQVVGNVTDGIARMAAFVSRHPGAAKAAGQLVAVLGVVMTALGVVAVGAAA